MNAYFAELVTNDSIEYDVSNRTFMTIYRCTEAFARLHLTNIVTKTIAQRAIDHLNEMLSKVNLSPSSKLDPSIYTFDKVIEYLQSHTHNKSDAKNLVTEIIQPLCLHDEIIHDYLGDIFNQKVNHKLHRLCEKILKINKAKLGIVGIRPAVVYWKHQKDCKCDNCSERLSGKSGMCDPQNPPSEDYDTTYFDTYAETERNNKKHKKKIHTPPEGKK